MVLMAGWAPVFPQSPQARVRPAESLPVPPELRVYVGVRSLVDESLPEIITRIPELKDVAFAPSQDDLAPLLQQVGRNIEALFQDFPNTSSVEEVRQQQSSSVARGWRETRKKYLYLISVKLNQAVLKVEEYRSNSQGEPLDISQERSSFMLTCGYVLQSLIFHPLLQSSCNFRLLGRQQKKPGFLLVAFAQRPEMPQFAGTLKMGLASTALLVQGVAWIDAETHRINKLWTDLLAPRGDFGILSHTTETQFTEVQFEHAPHPLWLPRQVQVTTQLGGWTYSNRHRYSDYKVFSVDAQDGEKKLIKP